MNNYADLNIPEIKRINTFDLNTGIIWKYIERNLLKDIDHLSILTSNKIDDP